MLCIETVHGFIKSEKTSVHTSLLIFNNGWTVTSWNRGLTNGLTVQVLAPWFTKSTRLYYKWHGSAESEICSRICYWFKLKKRINIWAKTLSNRQWALHQVLNSTCLSIFHCFSTVRNLNIFGFRIDGIPEQLNFLCDENKTIGKDVTLTHCLNSVLPMIDWTMQTHGAAD